MKTLPLNPSAIPQYRPSEVDLRLIHLAFQEFLLKPEVYYDKVWLVYGLGNTITVVPDGIVQRNFTLYTTPYEPGTFSTSDQTCPQQGKNLILFDALETITGTVCVMAELTGKQFVGRCSTQWLKHHDATDWHEATTCTNLLWELIDAYGDPEAVAQYRPAKIAG